MNISAFLMLLLAGTSLLLFGRGLFWVFVALAGFLLGFEATQQYLDNNEQWGSVLAGIIVGLLAALGSVFFQNLAVAVAGFVGGAYLSLAVIAPGLAGVADLLTLVVALLGGVSGALLFTLVFDPALVVASAITGAGLLIQPFALSQSTHALAWLSLTVIGVVFQLLVLSKPVRPQAQ